jgi:hypothetical protein
MYGNSRRGTSFIDVIISLGIIALLFGGIYLVYFSIISSVNNIEARNAAAAALSRQIEIIRNLPYDKIGTINGIPAGVLAESTTTISDNYTFTITTTVRNIDDPFDGTIGGVPNDTAPADYKLVELRASCATCPSFKGVKLTTTVSPKGLEGSNPQGSLLIKVFDADGQPISLASVNIKNLNITPTINLTDTTDVNGILLLAGVPTSTQSYRIESTKNGYSRERTYPIGTPSNPNPVKPDATIVAGQITTLSFAIDKLSQLDILTSNNTCNQINNIPFDIKGSKLIGTNPDILKFSTTSQTTADGSFTYSNVEWDTYSIGMNSASYDVLGTIPHLPLVVNPNSTNSFRFILTPQNPNSLLVSIYDAANGNDIIGAEVELTKSGFSKKLITGRNTIIDTDWSESNYNTQSSGIDTESFPGKIELLKNVSGTYDINIEHWLISKTIDVGSSTATYFSIDWNPNSQPPQTGSQSAKFQVAANNDNSSWNFIGPDGTLNTYYVADSNLIGLNDNRYLRYKVYISTENKNATPEIDDVNIDFYSVCVPNSQTLFSKLTSGSYTLTVKASGYLDVVIPVSITGSWQQIEIPMIQQ